VGLDPRQIVKIRELITELGREHTVILSTHILPEVEQICRRVLIIDDGTIVADGTPDQLRTGLAGTAEMKVQLEAPEAEALAGLSALRGASNVRGEGNGRFQVAVEGGADLRREVFALAVQKGWVLLELTQTVPSLETIFLRLTTHEAVAEQETPPGEVANA
jgi:ABC-2 type transport system ATP-binding protein